MSRKGTSAMQMTIELIDAELDKLRRRREEITAEIDRQIRELEEERSFLAVVPPGAAHLFVESQAKEKVTT